MKITKLDHVGIRVSDFEQSIAFYAQFGFSVTRRDDEEHVVVIKHPSGVELNLLDTGNCDNGRKNILMDVEQRYPGYTHYAIKVESVTDAKKFLDALGIRIMEGPVKFGDGKTSVFIRDPDLNVIEFTESAVN